MRDETLCIAPQNLTEFWAVATRPLKKNGLGMTTAEAESELISIRQFFRLLPYTLEVLEKWQWLVVHHAVSGKQSHDAHLAAIMQVHAVTDILTFNVSDFSRFLTSPRSIRRRCRNRGAPACSASFASAFAGTGRGCQRGRNHPRRVRSIVGQCKVVLASNASTAKTSCTRMGSP